ncbi:hypothetical protein LX32DRAFT_302843 [Colletotrichum zoysiae]|uniref:Uncharacterized protein n=1 Tax=Colletotrichum zoysiae TaxID=1216348 RepID=A0AAD9M6Z8_9PEZI|nr:hypothetical protein LX32DRAFT_302843 [Colletotrichum zoysiae]
MHQGTSNQLWRELVHVNSATIYIHTCIHTHIQLSRWPSCSKTCIDAQTKTFDSRRRKDRVCHLGIQLAGWLAANYLGSYLPTYLATGGLPPSLCLSSAVGSPSFTVVSPVAMAFSMLGAPILSNFLQLVRPTKHTSGWIILFIPPPKDPLCSLTRTSIC